MKKILLAAFVLSLFSSSAFAGWGAGIKLGVAENDPESMTEAFNDYGGELTKSPAFFGLEGFYEMPVSADDEANKIGLKLGLDVYGENEWKILGNKTTETTYTFPLTAYYKRDGGLKNWSFFGGLGLTFLRTKVEASGAFAYEESKNKIFFHLAAGTEYRFTEAFALGLDLKYNIGAKAKKDDTVLSDRSGIGGALAGRFYF